jgi:hypothetical protein
MFKGPLSTTNEILIKKKQRFLLPILIKENINYFSYSTDPYFHSPYMGMTDQKNDLGKTVLVETRQWSEESSGTPTTGMLRIKDGICSSNNGDNG